MARVFLGMAGVFLEMDAVFLDDCYLIIGKKT